MSVGLLGPSGAGKSTMLMLAPRLYDIPVSIDASGKARGSVLFDGRDVRDFKLADLRQAIALVPQQALLFEGTIRTNLIYANPDASEEEMVQAAYDCRSYVHRRWAAGGSRYARRRARRFAFWRSAAAGGARPRDCRQALGAPAR